MMKKSLPLWGISLAMTLSPFIASADDTAAVLTETQAPTLWDEITLALPANAALRNDGIKTAKTEDGITTEIKNPHLTWKSTENLQAIPNFEAYLDGILTIKKQDKDKKYEYWTTGTYHFLLNNANQAKPIHFTLNGDISDTAQIDLQEMKGNLTDKQLLIALLKGFKSDKATLKNVIVSLLTPEPKTLISLDEGTYTVDQKSLEKEKQEISLSCKSVSNCVYHSPISNFNLSHYLFISFFLPEIGKVKSDTDVKIIMPSWNRVIHEASLLSRNYMRYMSELTSLPAFSTELKSQSSCRLADVYCNFNFALKDPENMRQEATFKSASGYQAVSGVIEETKASFIKQFDAAVSQKSSVDKTENVKQITEMDQIIYNCVKSEAFSKLLKLMPLELKKESSGFLQFLDEPRLLSDWKFHFDLTLLTPKSAGLKVIGDGDEKKSVKIHFDILDKHLVIESTIAFVNTAQELLRNLGFIDGNVIITKAQTQKLINLLESVSDEPGKEGSDLHITINGEEHKPWMVGNKNLTAFAADLFMIMNQEEKQALDQD